MVMNVLIVIQLFSFMVMCAGAVGRMFALPVSSMFDVWE